MTHDVVVTRADLVRVLTTMGVETLPSTSRKRLGMMLRNLTVHPVRDVISVVVHDTLGEPGPLADALDVLADAGLLKTKLSTALRVGWHTGVVYGRGSWFWCVDNCFVVVVDGAPQFHVGTPFVHDLDFVMFRSGVEARLVPDRDMDVLRVHADDIIRVQGNWDPNPPGLEESYRWSAVYD